MMRPLLSLAVAAPALSLAAPASQPTAKFSGENMNGEYVISPTPGASGEYNTKWKDYPGGVECVPPYKALLPSHTNHC